MRFQLFCATCSLNMIISQTEHSSSLIKKTSYKHLSLEMNVQAACGRSDAETQETAVPVSDIDQHDIGNQLAVVDYIEDIYTFYCKTGVSS